MSMHITASPGDIAERILLPGDPLRAKYIAERYLKNAVCFNELRGMLGYTGEYSGERVSVMGTGMGIPSVLIYTTELCRDYGCQKLVRIGTAGGYDRDLKLMDVVLSQATSTTSALNDYTFPGHYAPTADFLLLDRAYHLAKEREIAVYVGNTLCNDHLYFDNRGDNAELWAEYGVIASEMEAAALYTVAARYKKQALTIMTIVETVNGEDDSVVSDEDKERSLDGMIKLALDTVL